MNPADLIVPAMTLANAAILLERQAVQARAGLSPEQVEAMKANAAIVRHHLDEMYDLLEKLA